MQYGLHVPLSFPPGRFLTARTMTSILTSALSDECEVLEIAGRPFSTAGNFIFSADITSTHGISGKSSAKGVVRHFNARQVGSPDLDFSSSLPNWMANPTKMKMLDSNYRKVARSKTCKGWRSPVRREDLKVCESALSACPFLIECFETGAVV